MSRDEIKYEITKMMDHLSDSALQELLTFLKDLEAKQHSSGLINSENLQRVLTEDKDLLRMLANNH